MNKSNSNIGLRPILSRIGVTLLLSIPASVAAAWVANCITQETNWRANAVMTAVITMVISVLVSMRSKVRP